MISTIRSQEERIHEMYEKWYDLREEVLRTYTNKLPERIPLEQQKEFKPIRNAVVQAFLKEAKATGVYRTGNKTSER